MKVYLASDHAGFELKEKIKKHLISEEFEVIDEGAYSFDPDDDYPDFIEKAARNISHDKFSLGIILGKSGAGEAIVANKIKGVRAAVGFSRESVELMREHNDANMLSLGVQFIDENIAIELVDLFLDTAFLNEQRHVRRIEKIKKIENV